MPQIQVDALATLVHQLPELVEQLKIANKLKAWELKAAYREMIPPRRVEVEEIDKIMKGN